jgi:pilus assembly protein CpaD
VTGLRDMSHKSVTPLRTALPVLVALSVALLAGCAKRDSITVGAVPDDYRTNHPIVIAEKDEVLDLAVGASDRGMTKMQRIALDGFFARYDRSAAPPVTILTPAGALNDVAAQAAAYDFAAVARANGVPEGRIIVTSYSAAAAEVSAPVRVMYTGMRAQTDKCGRWPEDILNTHDNKHYANFGCAYQNNLAAQIANPADLLGPRKPSEIDATKRGVAIDTYQNTPAEFEPEVEIDW